RAGRRIRRCLNSFFIKSAKSPYGMGAGSYIFYSDLLHDKVKRLPPQAVARSNEPRQPPDTRRR
ncbi:MAG: hypothetical protein ACREXN_13035, partial [Polaromonas sp.]